MIPLVCYTCGWFLGSITHEFESKKKKICSNVNYSEDKKEKEIQTVVNSLGIRRYCCKMRLISSKDLVEDIIPVSDDKN